MSAPACPWSVQVAPPQEGPSVITDTGSEDSEEGRETRSETQGEDTARGEEMQARIQTSKTTTKAKQKDQRPRDKGRRSESSGPGGSSQPSQSSPPGVGVVSQFIN